VNSSQRSAAGQHDGHALSVERIIDAPPEAIFDAFIALYDSQRPEWVTGSQLDLRPGGRWSVAFQVPDGPAFREERVITAVERPRRLAYGSHRRHVLAEFLAQWDAIDRPGTPLSGAALPVHRRFRGSTL
jgi:uncharacterized protein YndB with AHSA1/START domain